MIIVNSEKVKREPSQYTNHLPPWPAAEPIRDGRHGFFGPARPSTANRSSQPNHGFPSEYRDEFAQLLREFADVFTEDPRPTTTIASRHTIPLKDAAPFRQPPYRYSAKKKGHDPRASREDVNEQDNRAIKPPEYSSPIVVVKKKDGGQCFCVDYRRLKAQTLEEAAPLQVIQERFRDLGDAADFTSIDVKSGYWQVPLDENSKQYTAFLTPDGALYRFLMAFGLKNV